MITMVNRRWLALLVLATMLAGCAAKHSVEIREARAVATSPGAMVGAVYLDMVATGDDELLSVTTPVAERAEIHSSTTSNGMMQMRPMATVALRAGQVVRFAPGSMHLMLMNLHAPLKAGSDFPLDLQFRKQGTLQVQVHVVAPGSIDISH